MQARLESEQLPLVTTRSTRTRLYSLPKKDKQGGHACRLGIITTPSTREGTLSTVRASPSLALSTCADSTRLCSSSSSPEFNSSRFPQSSSYRAALLPRRSRILGHARTRHHSDPDFGPFPTPTLSLRRRPANAARRLALALGSRLSMVCLARKLDHRQQPAAASSSSTIAPL